MPYSCDRGFHIDWKHVANTPGYKSLKAAYIKDVQGNQRAILRGHQPMRDKAVFLRHFNWVINRAKHYAYKKNMSIASVLNSWEGCRNQWWLNYYQDANIPKLHSCALQPKKYKRFNGKPSFASSNKNPPRWYPERKKRAKRYREQTIIS